MAGTGAHTCNVTTSQLTKGVSTLVDFTFPVLFTITLKTHLLISNSM